MSPEALIVIPVFDDWKSLRKLVEELSQQAQSRGDTRFSLLVIDDGSNQAPGLEAKSIDNLPGISSLEIVRLVTNLGHQRAIAVGLALAHKRNTGLPIIVMDSDGEDRPADVIRMLDEHTNAPEAIILAERLKRKEGRVFRFLYSCYRLLFRILTGSAISHGNFSLIPGSRLGYLLASSHVWNNLAATINRVKVQVRRLGTERGVRYDGKSTMTLVSLIIHGLSAMSVYVDLVIARILIACFVGMLLSLLGFVAVLAIKFCTTLAIPLWATIAWGLLAIFFLQNLMIAATAIFGLLNTRSSAVTLPLLDAQRYVLEVLKLR